jgi:signal transduction histidine kinase
MPPTSLQLLADPVFLGQVIENLLDNAVKFSPRDGLIQVRAWTERDEAMVAVSDNGIGIPPDRLLKIFEYFYQVDGSATRRFGGMGIGLSLCNVIVRAHGGRIWAESGGEGQGSTFYVALHLSATPGQ